MRIILAVLLSLTLGLVTLQAQKIEKIGVPELEKILSSPDNVLHVVNFWATWCAPCVTELPYFEKLAKEYKSGDVKFVLVSLDFPSQIDSKLTISEKE